jgi:rubredoxin
VMVRVSMAQSALPHLLGRLLSANCPLCQTPKFSVGEAAFTPNRRHACDSCGHEFSPRSRVRKTILNPLHGTLQRLAKRAPRCPQNHNIGLLPETP